MSKPPCLPFCHWPTLPDPCLSLPEDQVCCIKWTVPCGNSGTFEASFNWPIWLAEHENTYYKDQTNGCPFTQGLSEFQHCKNSVRGTIAYAAIHALSHFGNDVYMITNEATTYNPGGDLFFTELGLTDLVGYTEAGCTDWPDSITRISGMEETWSEGDEFSSLPFSGSRRAFPMIRWSCTASGVIQFEVGWCVYHWIVASCGASVASYLVYDGSVVISSGVVGNDWYTRGDPFELDSVESGAHTFRSVVTPVPCNYVPCGDPLDCFASCISGTKDCDGVTPAHKPIVHFMLDIDGCCLSGTYSLGYTETITGPTGSLLGGKGYQGNASCDGGGGYTLLLHIVLYCVIPSSPSDPNYNDGKGYLVLNVWFGVSSGAGTSWSLEIAEGVMMSCSDGSLVPITGTVTDTDCGTSGSGDWSLY